jgi:hypothetical protein
MYEHRSVKLLSRAQFARRMLRHLGLVAGLIVFSLVIGMAGYSWFADLDAVDAFLNASMLLGGMGPVAELHTDSAKIFAGVYALYCGLVFIASAGVIVAPIAHRIFHRLHIEK